MGRLKRWRTNTSGKIKSGAMQFVASINLTNLSTIAMMSGLTCGAPHCGPAADSWYNLTWAVNGTGAPGVYSSSQTPDESYGQYNWCAMPHVRAREYKVPGDEYELVYIEVIQRHHKRTPYASNTFFKEDITWECDNEGPYHHARARDFATTPVYWQSERGTENPFEATFGPGFGASTCFFPSITTQGLDDSRQHGEDFASVYADLLHFLPAGHERDCYAFRVTNNVITTQTLSGFVKGLYPDEGEYAAWIQDATFDSLEPAFACPAADALRKSYEGTNPEWTELFNASAAVRERFDAVSGIPADDDAGWHTSWDHPYDNLSAKQCHGYPLPCSVNDTATCVSQSDADTIYRLGNWEYAYRYRGAANSTAFSALKMGPWFRELTAHLRTAAQGSSKIKYRHNFAHDGSLSPALGVLQIDKPLWPGMGSEIVFELWNKCAEDKKEPHLRVLWSGQPLVTSTPLGTLDMVPLDKFIAYLDEILPADPVAACKVAEKK